MLRNQRCADSDRRLFDASYGAIKTNFKETHPLLDNKANESVLYMRTEKLMVSQAQFRPVTYKATTLTDKRLFRRKVQCTNSFKALKKNLKCLNVILG